MSSAPFHSNQAVNEDSSIRGVWLKVGHTPAKKTFYTPLSSLPTRTNLYFGLLKSVIKESDKKEVLERAWEDLALPAYSDNEIRIRHFRSYFYSVKSSNLSSNPSWKRRKDSSLGRKFREEINGTESRLWKASQGFFLPRVVNRFSLLASEMRYSEWDSERQPWTDS